MDTIILVDKPAGMTSHDVVDSARRIFHTRKVGHAGTLDPFATGLLILGVGTGTKQLTALVGLDKSYDATLRLGTTSATFDIEGPCTVTDPTTYTIPTLEEIEPILKQFRGTFIQKAPLYSAKKIKGAKLYDLARAGTATEDMRPVKEITISKLVLRRYAWPELELAVSCSSGTYIRSLADDIGHALGCGAYLTALRRTKIGDFSIEQAYTLEALADLDKPAKF